MKLKEQQQQHQRDGVHGLSTTTEAGPSGRTKAPAKRKTGKQASAPGCDAQEAAQVDLASEQHCFSREKSRVLTPDA